MVSIQRQSTNNSVAPSLRGSPSVRTAARSNPRIRHANQKSQQKYQAIARSDSAWEAFIFALTGKSADERTPAENKAIKQLRKEMRDGNIAPEFLQASPPYSDDPNRLPSGVLGAFVPGQSGQSGTIVIAPGQNGAQLAETMDEEQGEAIAARAESLGITVAEGDAGARLSLTAGGDLVTPETHEELFVAAPDDTVVLYLEGKKVQGKARAATNNSQRTPQQQAVEFFQRAGYRDPQTGKGFIDKEALMSSLGIDDASATRILAAYGTPHPDGRIVVTEDNIAKMYADGVLTDTVQPPTTLGLTVAEVMTQYGVTQAQANQMVWGTSTTVDITKTGGAAAPAPAQLTPKQLAQEVFAASGRKPGEKLTAEEFKFYADQVIRSHNPNAQLPSIGAYSNMVSRFGDPYGLIGQGGMEHAFGSGSLASVGATGPRTQEDADVIAADSQAATAGYFMYDHLSDAQIDKVVQLMDLTERAAQGDPQAIQEAQQLYNEVKGFLPPGMQTLFKGLPTSGAGLGAQQFSELNRRLQGGFMNGLDARLRYAEKDARETLMHSNPQELATEIDSDEFKLAVETGGASGAIDYVASLYGVDISKEDKAAFARGEVNPEPLKQKVLQLSAVKFGRINSGQNLAGQQATKVLQNAVAWDLGLRTSEHGVEEENQEFVYVGDPNESPDNTTDGAGDGQTAGTEVTRSFMSVGRQMFYEYHYDQSLAQHGDPERATQDAKAAVRRLDEQQPQPDHTTSGLTVVEEDVIGRENVADDDEGIAPSDWEASHGQVTNVAEGNYDPETGLLTGEYANQRYLPVEMNLKVVMTKGSSKDGDYEYIEVDYGDTTAIEAAKADGFGIKAVRQTEATQGQLQMAQLMRTYQHAKQTYKPRYDAQGNLVNPDPTARFAQYYQQTDFKHSWEWEETESDSDSHGSAGWEDGDMSIGPSGKPVMTDTQALRGMLADLGLNDAQIDALMTVIEDEIARLEQLHPELTTGQTVSMEAVNALTFGLSNVISAFFQNLQDTPMTQFSKGMLEEHGRGTYQAERREEDNDPSVGKAVGQFFIDLVVDTAIDAVLPGLGKVAKVVKRGAKAAGRLARTGRLGRRALDAAGDTAAAAGRATPSGNVATTGGVTATGTRGGTAATTVDGPPPPEVGIGGKAPDVVTDGSPPVGSDGGSIGAPDAPANPEVDARHQWPTGNTSSATAPTTPNEVTLDARGVPQLSPERDADLIDDILVMPSGTGPDGYLDSGQAILRKAGEKNWLVSTDPSLTFDQARRAGKVIPVSQANEAQKAQFILMYRKNNWASPSRYAQRNVPTAFSDPNGQQTFGFPVLYGGGPTKRPRNSGNGAGPSNKQPRTLRQSAGKAADGTPLTSQGKRTESAKVEQNFSGTPSGNPVVSGKKAPETELDEHYFDANGNLVDWDGKGPAPSNIREWRTGTGPGDHNVTKVTETTTRTYVDHNGATVTGEVPTKFKFSLNKVFGGVRGPKKKNPSGRSHNDHATNVGNRDNVTGVRAMAKDRNDGGHAVGSQFMGRTPEIGIVPQDATLNETGGWKQMETHFADWLGKTDKNGKPFTIEGEIVMDYPPNNAMPDTLQVKYTVRDGAGNIVEQGTKTFQNDAGDTWDVPSPKNVDPATIQPLEPEQIT
ncbi:DNA/RNA non-specific endonuclease [Yoonia sp. 2307UL14-13]|uniref:DNA/RNA non-specific endonuclease n=1 Tax=Yoonia sp. 2307UL14-13 TaxID=3126506 RepID=UPI0030B19866